MRVRLFDSCSRRSATAATLASVGIGALRSLWRAAGARRWALGREADAPLRRAPEKDADLKVQGRRSPPKGERSVPASACSPGVPGAIAPIRSGGSSPDRHAKCGPRAQAVFGWLFRRLTLPAIAGGLRSMPDFGSGVDQAAAAAARTPGMSTRMPGPIVLAIV